MHPSVLRLVLAILEYIWQPIKFETSYLQCYQKLLFIAAATTCCPPFTAVRHPENSVPGIHHVPAELLQLPARGIPVCDESRLQSLHNAVDMIFGDVSIYDCVENVLRDRLYCRPICRFIKFQVGVIGCKAINWSCISLLEGFLCSSSKHLCFEWKPICSPWGLYHFIRNQEYYLLSTELCNGRIYIMELTSFRIS